MAIIHDKIDELDNINSQVNEESDKLDKLKGKQRELSEQVIPELMDALEQTGLKTDKFKVDVMSRYRPNLPQNSPEREEALAWLSDNGFSDALTYEVIVRFDTYEDAKAYQEGVADAYVRRYIHPQTLEALINEQAAVNPDFPLDIFNTYEQRRTKIKEA
jgi:membrane protease subunit (stomatin/prohibitin family)